MVLINEMKYILVLNIIFSFIMSSEFENVHILEFDNNKDMTKYMKSISKDLNVKCSHCHNLEDKSLDTYEKEIARDMIKLTRYLNNLLNPVTKDHEDYKTLVSCWTCHRGNLKPEDHRPTK